VLHKRQEKRADLTYATNTKRARTRKITDSFPCEREFAGTQTGSLGLRPPPGSSRKPTLGEFDEVLFEARRGVGRIGAGAFVNERIAELLAS
jgi:hypothetical protein